MTDRAHSREIRLHELKSRPEYFEPTLAGRRTFDMRKDDGRNYRMGDVVVLREWRDQVRSRDGYALLKDDAIGYTGRYCIYRVSWIEDVGGVGDADSATRWVILGFRGVI